MVRIPILEIWDFQLESLGENDICGQPPWPIKKNTIKGKVVASRKYKPW
jgi:hypothetical protein